MQISLNVHWSLTKGKMFFFAQVTFPYVQAGDCPCIKYPHNAELSGRLWSLGKLVAGMGVDGISLKL